VLIIVERRFSVNLPLPFPERDSGSAVYRPSADPRASKHGREIAAVATTEALEVERLIEVCYQIFRGLDSH
jgi:hypothetical protein